MVEFRILGPLEALVDGRPVALGGAKQRAVLALLLFEAGRIVPSERMIDALWSGSPPPTATASLQNFISQLRKSLGQETIETRAPGYRVQLNAEQLDLARLRRLIDEARASDPTRRAQLFRQALELWRGEPLAEFAYETFAEAEIARLNEMQLSLIEEWVEAELAVGRHADLVGRLEELVQKHPLRERLRAQLMLALYRSGRQADALESYRLGRVLLVDQLGVEPSPLLRQVHSAILRQEAAPRSEGTTPPPEHFAEVARSLLDGRLSIIVGADFQPMTAELARRFSLNGDELPRISEAVAILNGAGPLYDTLHAIAEANGEPTSLHRFLATLPALLRQRGAPQPLLVTTSVDLALERALSEAGEAFETVSYIASGQHRGSFCHVSAEGETTAIERPNRYAGQLSSDQKTVVLHLQGRLDATSERAWESFAVTEDDFIRYGDIASRLPVALAARLRRTHLLLLGYVLSDWTLRLIIERLFGEEPVAYHSWSIHSGSAPLEREFWRRRGVEVIDMAPTSYITELEAAIGS